MDLEIIEISSYLRTLLRRLGIENKIYLEKDEGKLILNKTTIDENEITFVENTKDENDKNYFTILVSGKINKSICISYKFENQKLYELDKTIKDVVIEE